MTIDQAIGATVKEARLGRGWSTQELANKIGCAQSTIMVFESGAVSWRMICDTSQALHTTPAGLLRLAEELKPRFEEMRQLRSGIADALAGGPK